MPKTSKSAENALDIPTESGSGYPSPFNEPCMDRVRRRLGDHFGLTDFGVNLVVLPPESWSSQRHWHTNEDEFIYIIDGTPTLITDEGETVLQPGSVAGFAAGQENGHHLVNKTDKPVTVLEVGSRRPGDSCRYSDIDMQMVGRGQPDAKFTRRNGEPY